MTPLERQLARQQMMGDALLSLPPKEMDAAIARIKKAAEKKSPFKKGQLVRLCRSPGISLVGGLRALPHNHSDPKQHSDSRVLGWSCLGGLMVAVGYGTNPHCGECTWTEHMVQPRKGADWKKSSRYEPGMELTFKWDQPGSWDSKKNVGDVTKAKLIEAHIKKGDWFVQYEKPDGSWITRVVNERYFIRKQAPQKPKRKK